MMFRILLHLFVFVFFPKLSLNADACSITLSSSTSQKEISNVRRVYIKEDVDLFGQTLYLSKRSKLICKGGSVKNGSIVFNETEITGNPHLLCNVKGTIVNEVLYPDWFLQDNNLDHLYENGFFTLTGMSKIEFQNKSYVSSVRSRKDGVSLSGIIIDGKGATIKARQGGSTIQSLLAFCDCINVELKDIILIGSDEASDDEGARHNLYLFRCDGFVLNNVESRNAFTDGLYIRKSNHLQINNYRAYASGRQGCSVTEGTDIIFSGCIFDGSHRVLPMAGLDIEPNFETDNIDQISIIDCSFTNNTSSGLTIKLKSRNGDNYCRIRVEQCLFEGNGKNISVSSAPYSGSGSIDITDCLLKNSKGVSFQSKCYSSEGTPVVRFSNSILENSNLDNGSDVREQAAVISVHNISSHPLECNFGNIELKSLIIRQRENITGNIKRAISLYPDSKYELENVMIKDINFDIEEKAKSMMRLIYIPKTQVRSVVVDP